MFATRSLARLRSKSRKILRVPSRVCLPGAEQPGVAAPGTLEFFLVERYLLFAELANRRIARGQVHHRPYPLQTATLLHCDQSLLAAAGIDVTSPPEHVIFSPGVDVEVFPLRAV